MKVVAAALLGWLLLASASAVKGQELQTTPRVIDLKASDGIALEPTYFPAATGKFAGVIAVAGDPIARITDKDSHVIRNDLVFAITDVIETGRKGLISPSQFGC